MSKELPPTLKQTGEHISFWGRGSLGWIGYEGEVFELFGVRVVVHRAEHRKWVVSEPTLGLRFPDGSSATKSGALKKAHQLATEHGGRRWFNYRLIKRAKAYRSTGPKPRSSAVAGLIIYSPDLLRRFA
jgi:hypothetical protein